MNAAQLYWHRILNPSSVVWPSVMASLALVALVAFAPDVRSFFIASREDCERAPRTELRAGEGLQVRIPRAWLATVPAWQGLRLGYTTRCVYVVPETGPTQPALFGSATEMTR